MGWISWMANAVASVHFLCIYDSESLSFTHTRSRSVRRWYRLRSRNVISAQAQVIITPSKVRHGTTWIEWLNRTSLHFLGGERGLRYQVLQEPTPITSAELDCVEPVRMACKREIRGKISIIISDLQQQQQVWSGVNIIMKFIFAIVFSPSISALIFFLSPLLLRACHIVVSLINHMRFNTMAQYRRKPGDYDSVGGYAAP